MMTNTSSAIIHEMRSHAIRSERRQNDGKPMMRFVNTCVTVGLADGPPKVPLLIPDKVVCFSTNLHSTWIPVSAS